MPRKKKVSNAPIAPPEEKLHQKDDVEKTIEDFLISEPVLYPNGKNDPIQMLEYNGKNAKQIMGFCGAYHMDVGKGDLLLFLGTPSSHKGGLLIKSGESLVKEGDTFKVID